MYLLRGREELRIPRAVQVQKIEGDKGNYGKRHRGVSDLRKYSGHNVDHRGKLKCGGKLVEKDTNGERLGRPEPNTGR